MGIYRPLVVTALLEGCQLPEHARPASMRMNLIGASKEDPRIMYIAESDKVLVYHFSTLTPSGLPTLIKRLSDPRCTDDLLNDKTINVLQVGHLGTEEVLVTADEAGDVCVWFTMNLQRDPLLLNVTESAWGIAIHSEKRLIAVSCNAHTATIFHCGLDSRLSRQDYSEDVDPRQGAGESLESASDPSSTSSSSLSSSSTATPLASGAALDPISPVEQTSQQILRGHSHNIPCVTFSPCGNFVATASVDQTCRTWRLSDGKQIQQKSLGQLWGWGVCFINQESWMTLSREEYKRIPKSHLEPGCVPGLNVRDSPITVPSQRRQQPIREYRMIRSRWYAGPLHNTSCDAVEENDDEDESENHQQSTRGRRTVTTSATAAGLVLEDHEEVDDQDTALFGMDDDESEDEWEDMSSSSSGSSSNMGDAEEMEEEHQERASVHFRIREGASSALDAEVSADTGEDGDIEGTGMDTEDGAGTAEEGAGASVRASGTRTSAHTTPEVRKGSKSEGKRGPGSAASPSTQDHHVSEASSSVKRDVMPATPGAANLIPERQAEEDAVNQDPSLFVSIVQTEQDSNIAARQRHGQQPSKSSPSCSSLATPLRPHQYPVELLACATSRNVYLLGRCPPAPSEPTPNTNTSIQENSSGDMPSSSESLSMDEGFSMDAEQDDIDEEQMVLTDLGVASMGHLFWGDDGDEAESEYDPDYDTDQYFEDMDEFMGSADEDDDEEEYHSDNGESEEDMDDGNPLHPHASTTTPKTSVPQLYTLSVARAAAARADGRRVHHLEHFDRLFVMLPIPELSILIAASQKGSLTIFRLLRVVADVPPLTPPSLRAPATDMESEGPLNVSDGDGVGESSINKKDITGVSTSKSMQDDPAGRMKHGSRDHALTDEQKQLPFSSQETITIEDADYVLFPEVYLPRLEPPPFPLIGVTVVPLQRPTTGSVGVSSTSLSSSTTTSSPLPSSAASSASFLLHLAYIDSQIYSYEIRLRNEKDDPVGLSNVFV